MMSINLESFYSPLFKKRAVTESTATAQALIDVVTDRFPYGG
ncbi:MAG: hypothetical protein AAGF93_08895 [Cyanobacteria bacterium P01_H01_bin.105]